MKAMKADVSAIGLRWQRPGGNPAVCQATRLGTADPHGTHRYTAEIGPPLEVYHAGASKTLFIYLSPLEMLRQKGQAGDAMKTVFAGEDFVFGESGAAEDFVDSLHLGEAFAAGGDGEDVVFVAGFHEQLPGGDEAGDVVHFAPLQNAWHVIVDAVGDAENAFAEGVEVAADERRL